MKVVVIEAGIGGLCLAHALRREGVEVAVYERDRAMGSRWEGYRIHINPTGARALHACLPAAGWAEFLPRPDRVAASGSSPSSSPSCS